jgi:CheY-like chemotaxis protein
MVKLEGGPPHWVKGDPGRLQQALSNLLSNAVKFTGKGGRVTVRAWADAASARVTVSDTGQGIEAEFLPHLFERFRQAESSAARKHGGLGLGLALVRQLVELHGGSVSAESPGPGQGSTFRVELPLRGECSASFNGRAALIDLPELQGLRVLVVDDDVDACQLVKRVLEESRMQVHTASSADEAFEQLKQHAPDIVLCDIGMPQGDGYQFITRVRASDDATPAIAVTGFARVEDRLRALRAGYQAHVSKPLDYAELLTAIASLSINRRPR